MTQQRSQYTLNNHNITINDNNESQEDGFQCHPHNAGGITYGTTCTLTT